MVSNDDMNGIDIKMVDYQDHRRMYRRMGKEEGQRMDIDFGESPNVINIWMCMRRFCRSGYN